jgi:hypothetical protein
MDRSNRHHSIDSDFYNVMGLPCVLQELKPFKADGNSPISFRLQVLNNQPFFLPCMGFSAFYLQPLQLILIEPIPAMTEKLYNSFGKRYFSRVPGATTGESLVIDFPGEENTGQGPDLSMRGYGSVEIAGLAVWKYIFCHRLGETCTYRRRKLRNVVLHVVLKSSGYIQKHSTA